VSGAIISHRSSKHETKADSITRAVSWTSSIMILLTKGEYYVPNDDVSIHRREARPKADMMLHNRTNRKGVVIKNLDISLSFPNLIFHIQD
jgi:hypothetical protein